MLHAYTLRCDKKLYEACTLYKNKKLLFPVSTISDLYILHKFKKKVKRRLVHLLNYSDQRLCIHHQGVYLGKV